MAIALRSRLKGFAVPSEGEEFRDSLEIRQHQAHVSSIVFMNWRRFRQAALASGALVLQQVIFVGFATHQLAVAGDSKALCSSFAGFDFRHRLYYKFGTIY